MSNVKMTEQEFLEWMANDFLIGRGTHDGFNNFENALDWVKFLKGHDFEELKGKTESEMEEMARKIVALCDEWMKP